MFFEEVCCQPPRLAFFVGQIFALIKNLQGNVNWPVGGGNHYFIFSLHPRPCTHICTNTHAFFYSREKQRQLVSWQGLLSPMCLFACHTLAKEQQINVVLCFLLPEEKICQLLLRVLLRADPMGLHKSPPREPCAAEALQCRAAAMPEVSSPGGIWHYNKIEGALLG